VYLVAKDFKHIKDPYKRRDVIVKQNEKDHDSFLQDAYNKTHTVVKNMVDECRKKLERTV
jgi:hypothetical protein